MITHDARRSLPRGNNPVPSPWLATTGMAANRDFVAERPGDLVRMAGAADAAQSQRRDEPSRVLMSFVFTVGCPIRPCPARARAPSGCW